MNAAMIVHDCTLLNGYILYNLHSQWGDNQRFLHGCEAFLLDSTSNAAIIINFLKWVNALFINSTDNAATIKDFSCHYESFSFLSQLNADLNQKT